MKIKLPRIATLSLCLALGLTACKQEAPQANDSATASTPAATATLPHGLRGSGLINRPSSLAKLHPVHGRHDAGSPPPVSAMAHGHATGRAAYADGVAHAIHRHAAPIR